MGGTLGGLFQVAPRGFTEVCIKFPLGSELFSGLNVTMCVSTDIHRHWQVSTNARVLQTTSAVSVEPKLVEGQEREITG